jgi:hypothetical protein
VNDIRPSAASRLRMRRSVSSTSGVVTPDNLAGAPWSGPHDRMRP